jgi:hypothetical protein
VITQRVNIAGKSEPEVSVEFDLYNSDRTGIPVLFSAGFMTEGNDRWISWLRNTLTDHPIYHVVWRSRNKTAVTRHLGQMLGTHLLRRAGMGGWIRRKVAIHPYSQAALTAYDLALALKDVRRFWRNTMQESERVGAYTAGLIQNKGRLVDEGPVIDQFAAIGHSLGAKLVMNTVQELDDKKQVEEVILAAAALDCDDHIWQTVTDLPKPVTNVYCRRDKILKYLYRLGNLSGRKAAGIAEVQRQHVTNFEMSEHIRGHNAYADNPYFSEWLIKKLGINSQLELG